MATEKNSFLLYCDTIHTIEKLSDVDAGQLLKHILRYVNDKDPVTDNPLVEIAFEPIRQSLKRDLVKYENIRTRNSENAKKRWNATASDRMPNNTKNADSDSDSDKDNILHIYRAFAHLKLSIEDFDKLRIEYSAEQINNVLDSIENFKSNKNYSSLYLTAKNWLKRDAQKNVTETSDDRLYNNVMAQISKNQQTLKSKKNVN